jgi:Transposase DDE domain
MSEATGFSAEVLSRLPLAQATLELARFVHQDDFLAELFEQHHADSYQCLISFPHFLDLVSDSLLNRHGSLAAALDRADEQERLVASRQAYYGKLRRLPLELSTAYLRESACRLRPLTCPASKPLPASLDGLEVRIVDGKKLKRVAKRLLATRGSAGKLFGGKLLVSWDPRAELVDALAADADGEVNECRLLPALLEQLPTATEQRPWLLVADRQFGDKKQPGRLVAGRFHFLFRRNAKTQFHADPQRPEHAEQRSVDAAGREVIQQFGWLGSGKGRLYVRQITLRREGEQDIVLVTDLLDAEAYPAEDLLELYRRRWGIEQVFGQITEVFGLERFIGSSAEATVFQAAFCLLLYNLIGIVKGYVAQAAEVKASEVSSHKLFESIHEELLSLCRLVAADEIESLLWRCERAEMLRARLRGLVAGCWKERYRKAAEKSPRRQRDRPRRNGAHTSVFRLQQKFAHKRSDKG